MAGTAARAYALVSFVLPEHPRRSAPRCGRSGRQDRERSTRERVGVIAYATASNSFRRYPGDTLRGIICRDGSIKYLIRLAGAPGFEPGNAGIKIRCLTT